VLLLRKQGILRLEEGMFYLTMNLSRQSVLLIKTLVIR